MHLSKNLPKIKQKKMIELRVKLEISTYKVEDFNTPFLVIHRMTRLKSVSTDNTWKTTNNQTVLIGNCRPFDPITTEQISFSSEHETL